MTVGITFSNRVEAVVCTDSRACTLGRVSNSVNKIEGFDTSKYHAAIIGAGNGNFVQGVFKKAADYTKEESVDEFTNAVESYYLDEVLGVKKAYVRRALKEIEVKAGIIIDEEEKKRFTDSKRAEVLRQLEDTSSLSELAIIAYDSAHNAIRIFDISQGGKNEAHMNKIFIGTGRDCAHVYMSQKMEGIDEKNLEVRDLLFMAVNSFSYATINAGVGGSPQIAVVNKQGIRKFTSKEANIAGNVSGAYLSEFITRNYAVDVMKDLIDKKIKDGMIAKEIGLTTNILTSGVIPANVWQEMANRKFYGRK